MTGFDLAGPEETAAFGARLAALQDAADAAETGWIAAAQEPLVSPAAGQVVGRPRGVGRLR